MPLTDTAIKQAKPRDEDYWLSDERVLMKARRLNICAEGLVNETLLAKSGITTSTQEKSRAARTVGGASGVLCVWG